MSFLSDLWNAVDLTSTTSNLFFTVVCTWIGFRAGVSSSREQSRRDRMEERESVFKSVEFFVCDCVITIRDAEENLRLSRPPHRAPPLAGIEYFQVQAMRHSEHDLFVALATLRSQIEQANTLLPVILDRFTTAPTESLAPADRRSPLQIHCAETLRRYGEVKEACDVVVTRIETARKSRNVKKGRPNQSSQHNAMAWPFSVFKSRSSRG